MLGISENKRTFEKDGKPFFYLADTCWSAFTNISDEEWTYYLKRRKQQGFNTLQINILPQWDASETPYHYYPLPTEDKKTFAFTTWNQAYFTRARVMCEQAKQQGFELALVVLWCNYVPDTWANRMNNANTMPYDFIDSYIDIVHDTFSDLHPMYIISGDSDFPSEQCISYYYKAFTLLKEKAKDCLFSMHIKGRFSKIPACFIDLMDFYMYQSGHNALPENKGMPYKLAQIFYHEYPIKPIINSEPCYEQMGSSGGLYGRWTQYDVRKAAWQSILSGACAGITYGAAGIYSWHKTGAAFGTGTGEGFATPKAWNDAMAFPGAWDYGFMMHILHHLNIKELIPCDLLVNENPEIRCAKNETETCYLIYLPSNIALRIQLELQDKEIYIMDMKSKNITVPAYVIEKGQSVIEMHPFDEDALIMIRA